MFIIVGLIIMGIGVGFFLWNLFRKNEYNPNVAYISVIIMVIGLITIANKDRQEVYDVRPYRYRLIPSE